MDRKLFEICVPFLLLVILGRTFALETEPLPPVVNIDVSGVIDSINGMFSGLSQSIGAVPAAVVDQFFLVLQGFFASFLESMLSLAKLFMTSNPNIAPMFPLWQTIVYVISLFYLVIFLFVGFLFIFSSIDAEKRVAAKQWFKSTVIMIAAVSASFYFYELFLELGSAVASYLWSTEFETLFQANSLTSLNIVLLAVFSGAVFAAFVTFFVRYLFLVIGAAIFPIALFFYFMPTFKPWGKMMLEIIFAGVLMQIIDVIIFIGAEVVWQQFSGVQDIVGWAPTMAFCLVAIANTIIILFAVLKATKTVTQQLPEVVAIAKTAGTAAIGALA